jgi:hypothetical protein
MKKNLLVRVGNGSKQHWAYTYEINDRKLTFLACGSNKIRGMRVIGELQLETYANNPANCEKCLARVVAKLEKVVA